MKNIYLLLLLLFIFGRLSATHIVGGEIQVKYQGNGHLFVLNLYFDAKNGNPNAEDDSVQVHIFNKANNRFVQSLWLPRNLRQNLIFSNPACTSNQISTRILRYARLFNLNTNNFSEPAGYYVVWERCCRNNVINNIDDPGGAGMTFYTEFPPARQNQATFLNSSPEFSIPKGDYLCLNEPFQFEFGATDANGDELRYELSTPFNGNSTRNNPGNLSPVAGPYSLVSWLFGFSANSAIPNNGLPASQFKINAQTGQITVTPNLTGLFVFSIICREFRNGTQIGLVRRDYQLMVLDCPKNQPPSIQAQIGEVNGQAIFYQENQIITVDAKTNELCFKVWLKDQEVNQNLSITAEGRNFQLRQSILSASQGRVNGVGDSLKIDVCWPRCLISQMANNQLVPFEFDLIVRDNGCPSAKADTLKIKLISNPVINNKPLAKTDAAIDASRKYDYIMEKKVYEAYDFEVFGEDLIDNDQIELTAVGRGFNLADYGMKFNKITGIGSIQSHFNWETVCEYLTESRTEFVIDFIVKDKSICENKADTVSVLLVLNDEEINLDFLPPNVFTPNQTDDKNQFFKIDDLPADNCLYKFKNIQIYNRWGNKVYESPSRDFQWDGGNSPTGTYYYHINYSRKIYKGTITLIK
jgi:gliding motility-associated-like protein